MTQTMRLATIDLSMQDDMIIHEFFAHLSIIDLDTDMDMCWDAWEGGILDATL